MPDLHIFSVYVLGMIRFVYVSVKPTSEAVKSSVCVRGFRDKPSYLIKPNVKNLIFYITCLFLLRTCILAITINCIASIDECLFVMHQSICVQQASHEQNKLVYD